MSAAERLAGLAEQLPVEARQSLRKDEPLSKHTSFRIGGPADLFFEPPSAAALGQGLAEAHRRGVPVTFLGGGTNLLVSDLGVRGLVVRLGAAFDYRRWEDGDDTVAVEVGAATPLVRLVRESVERGLAGIEFAAGIPGSVGGGALMNAGAFGGEIGAAIERIDAVTEDGRLTAFERGALAFSYRQLALDPKIVVTSVRFRLRRASAERLKSVVERVQERRRRGQPLGHPNAGSIFKNPPEDYAGKLIEHAGLKGKTVGRAQISPEHANFIVNLGGASAADVRALMQFMQEEVWRKSGIWLEPEVRLVGEWDVAETSTQKG